MFLVILGKEFHSSKLYVFRLADFEDEDEEARSRAFCRNHRIDKSRGNVTEIGELGGGGGYDLHITDPSSIPRDVCHI